MEQAEIEPLVSELESRVDRLRSLYDQYFMGIERLEPLVPRKDVERRLAMLRKEQIRNTGVRFRFQMIIQRFNTYVTYWQRISRQIETGTFKRHVARATARFGVDPTKEQAAEASPAAEAQTAKKEAESESPPSSAPLVVIPDGEIEEIYDLVALPDEGDGSGGDDDPFGTMAPIQPAARVPPERFASAVKFELDDIADPFEEADPFPKPAQKKQSTPQLRASPRAQGAPPPEGSRDTERRIPIAPPSRPTISKRPPPDAVRSESPPMQVMSTTPGLAPPPRLIAQVGPNAPRVEAAPRRPGTLPSAGVPGIRVAPPAPASAPKVQVAAAPANSGAPRALPPLTRASPADAANAAPPVARPAPPSVAKPAAPSVASPSTSMLSPAAASVARPAPASIARPAPSVAKPPPASAPAASAKPAPASRVGDLTGDRFGEIYSKYVETRRQHNEPTHAITRDALAKQLSESTDRLKQKHGSKAIDFEVVVKDGRTILRPVVK